MNTITEYTITADYPNDFPKNITPDCKAILHDFVDRIVICGLGIKTVRIIEINFQGVETVTNELIFETVHNNAEVLELVLVVKSDDTQNLSAIMNQHGYVLMQTSYDESVHVFAKTKIMNGAKLILCGATYNLVIKFPLRLGETKIAILNFGLFAEDLTLWDIPEIEKATEKLFLYASKQQFDFYELRNFILHNKQFVQNLIYGSRKLFRLRKKVSEGLAKFAKKCYN